MADEALAEAPERTQGAPTAPMMRAPVAPAGTGEQLPKRGRRRGGNATAAKRGRAKQTDAQKEAARAEREQAAQARAEAQANSAAARRGMARLAAIGALTPHLLSTDEVSGLAKFVLAMVQQQPESDA